MRVLDTYVFTYEQFKEIEVLCDIVTEKYSEDQQKFGRDIYLTLNDWPCWFMITVLVVSNKGKTEVYVKRPYYKRSNSRGSTTYKETLIKANEAQQEKLLEEILPDSSF
jgi:hypothetical protein